MARSKEPIYMLGNAGSRAVAAGGENDMAGGTSTFSAADKSSIKVKQMNFFTATMYSLTHRRGLYIAAWLLSFGIIFIIALVMEILHITDPVRFSPLGTINKFGGLSSIMAFLSSVAGVLLGTAAGVGDLGVGMLRNLVATGRSRMSVFFTGLLVSLTAITGIMLTTLVLFGIASYFLGPNYRLLTFSVILRADLWIILYVLVWTVISFGIANWFGSRSIAIGVILVSDLFIGGILSSFSAYPGWRQAFIGTTLRQIMPAVLNHGSVTRIETGWQAAIVIILWLTITIFLGARQALRREL